MKKRIYGRILAVVVSATLCGSVLLGSGVLDVSADYSCGYAQSAQAAADSAYADAAYSMADTAGTDESAADTQTAVTASDAVVAGTETAVTASDTVAADTADIVESTADTAADTASNIAAADTAADTASNIETAVTASDAATAETADSAGNAAYTVTSDADEEAVPSAEETDVSSITCASTWMGVGNEDEPYEIDSYEDLEALAEAVAAGETYADTYFALIEDVALESDWTGIGTSDYAFEGDFNGCGYTIDWGTFTSDGEACVGIFDYAGSSSTTATISNLHVKGSITFTSEETKTYAGGIVAIGYCEMEDCTSSVSITTSDNSGTYSYTGGIIAYGYTPSKLTGCANTGTIRAASHYTGGVAGYMNGVVTNCLNSGDITSTYVWATNDTSSKYYACLAGISGSAGGSSSFITCVNAGDLSIASSTNSYARIASINTYARTTSYLTLCYTTYDIASNDTTHVNYDMDSSGETWCVNYTDSWSLEYSWILNTQDGTLDNALFWSMDDDGEPVFADQTYPAAVRLIYSLSSTTETVYLRAGSTAAAPDGYEDAVFTYADGTTYTPGSSTVTEDVTVYYSVTGVLLKYYYKTGSTDESNLYATEVVQSGAAFAPTVDDPTLEYSTFAGWVDENGKAVNKGDILTTDTLFATWTPQSVDGVYMIASAEGLEWFRDLVNNGSVSADAKLLDDMTITDGWDPIGNSTTDLEYTGTFDGGGYTVTITIDGTYTYAGFFSVIGESGTVQNLTVAGTVTGTNGAGGIACYNYGTITDCVNQAAVTGRSAAGGITGYNYGTVISCGNEGTITAVHTDTSTSYATYAGGIAGTMAACYNAKYVYNCYNWGDVSASTVTTSVSYRSAAGGIVGETASASSKSSYSGKGYHNYIENCYSTGTITASHGNSSSYAYSGSILGLMLASYSTYTYYVYTYLTDCRYLEGTADAAYNVYHSNNTTYLIEDSVVSVTEDDYATLLTFLNTNAEENDWTTWYADADASYKPAFRASELSECTVTYEGDYEETLTVTEGTKITLPVCEETGYTYTCSIDGTELTGTTYTVTADVTITVTKETITYTAYFVDEDGNVVDKVSFTIEDEALDDDLIPAVPEKDGYVALWSSYILEASDLTIAPDYRLIGDVDGNGSVQTKDAVLIRRYLADAYTPDALGLLAADTDGDDAVTENDAQRISLYIAGTITDFS